MILSSVLIFYFGSLVSCFPSKDFAGHSTFINDIKEITPKIHKSGHKKSHLQSPPVTKFLNKFLLANDYSTISDFCNISQWNWQLINSGVSLSTPLVPGKDTPTGSISNMNELAETFETSLVPSGSTSIPTSATITTESVDKISSTITPDFRTNTLITNYETNATTPETGTKEGDDCDHNGTLTRILLILIFMLQNVFLFVMVLFYRNTKKPGKKCDNI